jgi:uncharacterized repeat protein (TIGR03803 family)
VQASDRNLYGTTFEGGPSVLGTIFKITLDGQLTTIYNFCLKANCPDGSEPASGLLQATNGILYGTASSGGTYDEGTVFSVAASLPPFVSLISSRGKVGTRVEILGQGFTDASGVSFNGAPAWYTAVSDTFLTALVPDDSTNGTITVKVAAGVLKSNTQFDVIPVEASFSPPNGPMGRVTIKGGGFLGNSEGHVRRNKGASIHGGFRVRKLPLRCLLEQNPERLQLRRPVDRQRQESSQSIDNSVAGRVRAIRTCSLEVCRIRRTAYQDRVTLFRIGIAKYIFQQSPRWGVVVVLFVLARSCAGSIQFRSPTGPAVFQAAVC